MESLQGKIDQDKANHLNKAGGTVLCWNVPQKIHFGIDYLTFETAEKFKGVKMIPPGPHFIHTSVQNAERMGFFIWLKGKQIDVYEWDDPLKCLVDFSDSEQADRLKIGVQNFDFDSNLGAYPLRTFSKWQKLSNHINQKLIKRLGPKSGIIASTLSEIKQIQNSNDDNGDNDQEMKANDDDALNQKYLSAKHKFEHYHPKYTKIPSIKSFKNLKPSQLTALQMDRSEIFYKLLKSKFADNELDLLGELQYAFICLLVGQSVQGLEQWKCVIDLLMNCQDALQEKQSFYAQFVATVMTQFKELPKDFFRDEMTNQNFLNECLQSFMEIVNETVINNSELRKNIISLKQMLSKRFDKIFDIDTEGPTVVSI